MDAFLTRVYSDPTNPASFGGLKKLVKAAKDAGFSDATYGKVRDWAQHSEIYGTTKTLVRRFKRPHVTSPGLDCMWEADLIDFHTVADQNDGYKYVLVAEDVFSRFIFTYKLKSKAPKEVVQGFKSVFATGRQPKYSLRTDGGSEFRGQVESYLTKLNIKHMIARSDIHGAFVERVIKTVKGRLYRYFLSQQSHRWVGVLGDITSSYNAAKHRMTGFAPRDVSAANEGLVAFETHNRLSAGGRATTAKSAKPVKSHIKSLVKAPLVQRRVKPKYSVGDTVRIASLRRAFGREYDLKYSGELFKVASVYMRDAVTPIYKLIDLADDPIEGGFYEKELSRAHEPQDGVYKVEKVLKTKGKGANRQVFVSWLHYPSKFNSWIPASQVRDVT